MFGHSNELLRERILDLVFGQLREPNMAREGDIIEEEEEVKVNIKQ